MKKTILIILVNIIVICVILLFMSVSNKNIHEFPIGNTIENGNIQVRYRQRSNKNRRNIFHKDEIKIKKNKYT